MDDLRLAADARAARPRRDVGGDPAAPAAPRTPTGASCSSRSAGLLPMCGHGTIGVATVLVETGMVEVTEPETVIRLDVPAGLGRGAGAGRDTAAPRRSRSATSRRSCTPGATDVVEVPGLGHDQLRHGLRRELLRDHAGGGRGPGRRPGAQHDRAGRGGPGRRWRRSTQPTAGAPGRRADQRLPPRRLPRAGPRRRRRGRRDLDPPGVAGPLPVRHRHVAPGWRSCRRRGASWPWTRPLRQPVA